VIPTLMPTSTITTLAFSSTVTFSNVTSPTLSSATEDAIVESYAISLNISSSDVTYEGTEVVSSSTSRLRRLSTTYYTLKSILQTTIVIDESSSNTVNATKVYSMLTSMISTAVTNGDFSKTLAQQSVSYGTTQLSDVVTESVVNSNSQITTTAVSNNSSKKKPSLSSGIIAAITIASIVGGLIIMYALRYYWKTLTMRKKVYMDDVTSP